MRKALFRNKSKMEVEKIVFKPSTLAQMQEDIIKLGVILYEMASKQPGLSYLNQAGMVKINSFPAIEDRTPQFRHFLQYVM